MGQWLLKKIHALKPVQILAMGFLCVILLGALLLTLPIATVDRDTLGFVDAAFTATSAVCVTGLVVVNTGVTFSLFGQIVILCLIQIGGLGFMTVTAMVFMMIGKRITLRERLVIQEAYNAESLQGMVKMVRNALLVTFTIEGAACLLFTIRFVFEYDFAHAVYYAVFLSVSAFCNAGFDPFGFENSITPYVADPVVNFLIMALILLGGIGFSVILDVIRVRRWSRLTLHSRVVLLMTGILIVSGTLVLCLLEWNNPLTLDNGLNPAEKVMAAGFQSVTLRTAGFDTIGQGGLTPAGQMVSIILMFIGASPASTGGGIKTTTFFIVLLSMVVMIRRKEDYNIYSRRLNLSLVRRAQAIVFLALGLVLVDTVVISAVESMTGGTESLAAIFFEGGSALGTGGLWTGCTPSRITASKIVICLTMFIGRVGPLTVSMALAGNMRKPDAVRYPEGRIMVG